MKRISIRSASIRPRPFSRGNKIDQISRLLDGHRFNSATTFQPWKPGDASADRLGGVMLQYGHDLSAVETVSKDQVFAAVFLLRFGHDLSAVETGTLTNCTFPTLNQLQYGHDFSAVETFPPHRLFSILHMSFNTATTFQPWKLSLTAEHLSRECKLQYGHDLSAVETGNASKCPHESDHASIRPRPFSRGNRLHSIVGLPIHVASIRPRPFSRGNVITLSRVAPCSA